MDAFIWKKKEMEIKINTLEELLDILIKVEQENIDPEIKENVVEGNLLQWLEQNFSKELALITKLKDSLQKFTPQQIREMLIRELRTVTSAS